MSHENYQQCIDACQACAIECLHCTNACLQEDDVKMLARCIKLNQDCAGICRLAVDYMSGGSEFAEEVCRLCADICNECGKECQKHSQMEHCQVCADACYHCYEECRKMVHQLA